MSKRKVKILTTVSGTFLIARKATLVEAGKVGAPEPKGGSEASPAKAGDLTGSAEGRVTRKGKVLPLAVKLAPQLVKRRALMQVERPPFKLCSTMRFIPVSRASCQQQQQQQTQMTMHSLALNHHNDGNTSCHTISERTIISI